jgi:GGDEF domain-containing protein
MMSAWEEETPIMEQDWDSAPPYEMGARIDMLMPADAETCVADAHSVRVYLTAMMELSNRVQKPLSLLTITIDPSPTAELFFAEDAGLVGRAIARCLRQETRAYDVIGRVEGETGSPYPVFVLVCPLMSEEQAAGLGDRLRATMRTYAADAAQDWLTLSAGAAGMALDTADAECLLRHGQFAVRQAQSQGGDQVCRFSQVFRSGE